MGDNDDSNVCRDFMRGACTRPHCKYSHPNEGDGKKLFCHDFQNNRCSRPNCKYLHYSKDEEEYYKTHGQLPESSGGGGGYLPQQQSSPDKPLCKDFIHGKCFREDRCKFYHPPSAQAPPAVNAGGGFQGGFNNFGAQPGFSDFPPVAAMAGNFGPAAKRSRGELYDDDPATLIHHLRQENVVLQGNLHALQRRVQHLEAANEMLLEQNAKLRTGSAPHPAATSAMFAQQWNGSGLNGPMSKF